MIRLTCPSCGARVFFDDLACMSCSTGLAYDLASDVMTTPGDHACRTGQPWRCNWLRVPGTDRCAACGLDAEVSEPGPDLTVFQAAVRRVMRQFHLAGIDPTATAPPLRFALLRSGPTQPVTIGHEDGLVTLDVAEGNPAQLADVQTRLGEPYRTPLGHVRHESGHWHWQAFVAADPAILSRFRELFGDEEADYGEALQRHYAAGDDGSWRNVYVSYYATAHPWEDYAESFAHVLHLRAMVETARSEGFVLDLPAEPTFDDLYRAWVPLTISLNEIARSMGTAEPYPFAPPAPAVAKMAFVADLLPR